MASNYKIVQVPLNLKILFAIAFILFWTESQAESSIEGKKPGKTFINYPELNVSMLSNTQVGSGFSQGR